MKIYTTSLLTIHIVYYVKDTCPYIYLKNIILNINKIILYKKQ
jgi:hypothetical protein